MKWCCIPFENHYQIAGERGIAIVVDIRDERDPVFLLQSRAFDLDRTPRLDTAEPMSLVTETAIDFCPWCGKPLAKWYGRSACDLARPDLVINRGIERLGQRLAELECADPAAGDGLFSHVLKNEPLDEAGRFESHMRSCEYCRIALEVYRYKRDVAQLLGRDHQS